MRYMNPGYAELFNTTGMSTSNDPTYNPYSGVSFYPTATQNFKILENGEVGSDVYCRFSLYLAGSSFGGSLYLGLYPPNTSGNYNYIMGLKITSGGVYVQYSSSSSKKVADTLSLNTLHDIHFNVYFYDNTEGYCQVKIDDTEEVEVEFAPGSKFVSDENLAFKFYCTISANTTWYMSNLIIKDYGSDIDSRERVIVLPVSAIETDMTESNGTYIADAAGQTLLQTPDIANLANLYGGASAVTGISVVGNTAYRTGTGIANLIGISKADSIISQYDERPLSTSAKVITDGWELWNTTLNDLQNMQFGWKAGE